MVRRSMVLLGATVLAALTIPALPAAAGGGGACHGESTTGQGDTVEMLGACFTPTTLRIDPGDTVNFVNRDPIVHNVGGGAWGSTEDMDKGDAFTATFAEAGIFPYACTYHPGMTGAIVVGDGTGAGNGDRVTVASYRPPAPPAGNDVVAAGTGGSGGSDPLGWVAAGAGGLVLGAGMGLGAGRFARRRSSRDATSS